MTISVVQAVKATGSSTSSLSLTLASTTAGNTIVVFFSGGTTSGAAITGITVALGATGDVFHPLGLSSVFISTGSVTLATTAAFADYNCTGSQTAVTISYTTSGTVGVAAYAYEVSGLGSTPVLDQNSIRSAASDSTTTLFVDNVYTTGPVQTTANNAILLASVNALQASSTPTLTGPGGAWTSETGQSYTTSLDAYMISGYQVVSSTGTYVYTPTATAAAATDGIVVALAASTTNANPYIVQYCNLTNYTADSYSAVMPKDFTAGNLVVVSEMAYAYTGTPPTMSIPTLTPSSDALSAAVGPTTPSGTHPTAGIYYYQNVPASQTGIAASVTGSTAADTIMQASIYEYGNMPTTGSAVDKTATATGASTAPSSGSTGTTTEPVEVIVGQIAYTNSTTSISLTPPASPWSWGEVDDFAASLTQIGVQIPATQISSSETTFSISGTISSSEDWAAQVATFFTPPTSSAVQPDVPQFNPGPTWFKHFKSWFPRASALTQPEYTIPAQTCSGSIAMVGMGFAATASVANPYVPAVDQLIINPGPTWLAHFKPFWHQRNEIQAPPSNPFFGQLPNYTDLGPNINPGPTWLSHFKPWLPKRPVNLPPAPYQNPISMAMAPMAMSATATVYPTMRGGLQQAALVYGAGNTVHVPIITSGSMAMAPMHFSGTVAVPVVATSFSMAMAPMGIYTPPTVRDFNLFNPGPTWLAHFKSPLTRRKLKVSGGPSFVTTRGSMSMAVMRFGSTNVTQYEPFPQFPLQLKYEVLINGTWIDISGFVYARNNQVITRGLPDETQAATPSQMTLTLNNRDGRFSPNNPLGAYYPYLTRNVQLRCSINNQTSAGGLSNYSGYRFWGEVSSWPVRWDPSQTDIYCDIVVSGPLRRFVQSVKLGSTMYQYYTSLTNQFTPYAYWPCEDGSGATEIASALPSVGSMSFTGAPQFASNASFGGSDPIPVISASSWTGETAAAADPPGAGSLTVTSPGTYFWVCPPGVTAVTGVVCIGGGGGGGDQNTTVGGGGGGGGGVDKASSIGVTAGTKYFYHVGAGGGTTSGQAGGNGVNSTWAGDTHTATGQGGLGGQYGSSGGNGGAGNTYNGGSGAAGSASSGGYYSDQLQGSYGASGGGGDGGQTTTSWTAPDNITGDVSFNTEGGGGGGGAAATFGSSVGGGGGGGGGGQSSGSVSASGGDSFNISAGNGGSGSSPNGGHGGTGGESDFDGNGSAGGGSGGLEGGSNPAGGAGGSPSGGTGGSGGGLISVSGGNNTSPGGSGGSPNGGAGGQATVISNTGYQYYGNGGGGGSVSWSWNTSDAPVGGGGGSSAGTSTGGNSGSGTSGGSAPTGGGSGGSCGATPAGSAPGGGGAGANPSTSSGSATSPGAGAPGSVSFAWTGGATSPVAADIIRFCLEIDSAGAANGAVLMEAVTYGTVQYLDVTYTTGGNITLTGLSGSRSVLFTSSALAVGDGTAVYVDIELTQSGTGANWLFQSIIPGATSVQATTSGTVATVSVGNVSQIEVDPANAVIDNATSIGQITVQTYADTMINMSPIVAGYAGETAVARMSRLCAAQGVGFTLVGNASDTPLMGPQQDDTFVNVMQSCSDFDRGQLYETRNSFGIGYRTRVNLQSQSLAFIANYTAAVLAGELQPIADDQFTRNDITVTRNGGASSRQFLASGPMSILTPPNGVGDYTYSLTVQAYTDTQLLNLVAWMLTVGTVGEYRYPTIEFDMARSEVAAYFATIPALDIGDFIQVYNQPFFVQNTPINQLFWGVTETLNNYVWTIQINTVPQSPYSTLNPPTW